MPSAALAALTASSSLDLTALDAALPADIDDPLDAQPQASATALLARLPRLLTAAPKLAKKLDAWAEGLQPLPPVDDHVACNSLLLQLTPRLLEAACSDGALLTPAAGDSADEPSPPKSRFAPAPKNRFEEEAAAREQYRAVRARCPLFARLLAALGEVAAEGGAISEGAEPLQTPEVSHFAHVATEALARSSTGSLPLARARAAAMGDVCRLLHSELSFANSLRRYHRTRRLAAALCHCVTAVPMPHLGRSIDAHKLLPMLLLWARELLDAPARASVLRAVHHAITNLPASEVRWHAVLLSVVRHMVCRPHHTSLGDTWQVRWHGVLLSGSLRQMIVRTHKTDSQPTRTPLACHSHGLAGCDVAAGLPRRRGPALLAARAVARVATPHLGARAHRCRRTRARAC